MKVNNSKSPSFGRVFANLYAKSTIMKRTPKKYYKALDSIINSQSSNDINIKVFGYKDSNSLYAFIENSKNDILEILDENWLISFFRSPIPFFKKLSKVANKFSGREKAINKMSNNSDDIYKILDNIETIQY